jgi:hypothetical protein
MGVAMFSCEFMIWQIEVNSVQKSAGYTLEQCGLK